MNPKPKSPPTNENHTLSSQQIEIQQQRLQLSEQKISALNERKQQLQQERQQLASGIAEIKQKIKKKQELDNPIVKQLREHFKALREEIKQSMVQEQEEEDNIDIDNMTYEELLELGQNIGKVSKGLSNAKFEALDHFNYENDLNLQEECTICREQFEQGHDCVKLDCKHFFHRECLKGWTQVQKICPNCKEEIK